MRLSLRLGIIALFGMSPGAFAAVADSYSIDSSRYFASPAAEAVDRDRLVAEIAAFPSSVPPEPGQLEDYLHHAGALLADCRRHDAYLHLRSALDIDDSKTEEAYDQVGSADGKLIMAVRKALRSLGDTAFAAAAAKRPSLARYRYLLEKSVRGLPHELPPEQAVIVDDVADPASSTYWSLYQKTLSSTDFAKLGSLDVRKDAKKLLIDPDRDVRQAAWQKRWEGFDSRADIYAGLLLGVVRLNDKVAHLHHFEDAPAEVYFRLFLSRDAVSATLAAVQAHANVMKDYQRLRSARIAGVYGLQDVRSWDMSLPEKGFDVPRFSLDRAREVASQSLAPLGGVYVAHFKALLDPRNGRMDIASEQGTRVNDGFSISAPGIPSGLFISRFDGFIEGPRVLVHEGGHAIHGQLMNESGVSPFYTGGPSWLFESYAIFNEMLLFDHLEQASRDPRAKAYYLQSLIDDMTFQIFTSAEEATLESAIYDGVIAGKVRNATDLDALTLKTLGAYEIWPALEPELGHAWMTKRLMYEDPLYLANYLYAGLLATKMYDMAKHDPAGFHVRYEALLRRGFDAPPDVLLHDFFGRDIPPGELVEGDMTVIAAKVHELSALYRRVDTGR
ncbi:MAG TPA: M3 family metallopeptidase [Luteibacter sp.]|jgi:oligoendopeptidase F|nr:M3 family metallopeptidase [Luteibacter sp.]